MYVSVCLCMCECDCVCNKYSLRETGCQFESVGAREEVEGEWLKGRSDLILFKFEVSIFIFNKYTYINKRVGKTTYE